MSGTLPVLPEHLDERAGQWLQRNLPALKNYLDFRRSEVKELEGAAAWLFFFINKTSLRYYLLGRYGPFSDELRDLEDILHLCLKRIQSGGEQEGVDKPAVLGPL